MKIQKSESRRFRSRVSQPEEGSRFSRIAGVDYSNDNDVDVLASRSI